MKKLILYMLGFLCFAIANSQVTNESPKSSELSLSKILGGATIPMVKMPGFDLQKLQEEDRINDQDKSKIYRFGYEMNVDLGITNAGLWTELPNGDRIWRIHIVSEEAKTLNFVFNSFKLPEGGKVYLYNEAKTFHLGAYTHKMNNSDETIGTWLADGDSIIIEYYEPYAARGLGKLNIGSVVHGYRSKSNFETFQKALNDSGDCNQDVNCSVGSDFDSIKDIIKKAVGITLVGNSGFCSGTLINNTSNDETPYFLTANHCGEANSNWAFRFNWISTNTVCATTDNSIDNGPSNFFQTTSGATLLARNTKSDFQLVEITGGLDENWDIDWVGWDRSETTPSFAVGIHHPSGDIMKVCRENESPTRSTINFNGNTSAEMWNVADWDLGVTERGSSGSALFDPLGRIIGQLTGGEAACSGTVDNDQFDFYGRFDVSWDFGTTNATRLSNWLDPTNTGRTTLNSLSQEMVLSVNENELNKNIIVYPNPSNGIFTVLNNSENILSYDLLDITGRQVGKGEVIDQNTILDMSSNTNGMYFIAITDTSNNTKITKKIVIDK